MTRRAAAAATRAKVLDAAVRCILEVGYYQASSNAIAREAGVTWGTIQHQFGTREALMLEVVSDGLEALNEALATETVIGDNLEERLHSVFELLEGYYGRPEHLVHIEILLDLSADPSTSTSARRALQKHGASLTRVWEPYFVQAMGEAGHCTEIVEYVFLTFFKSGTRRQTSCSRVPARIGHRPAVRRLLVQGVASAVPNAHASLD